MIYPVETNFISQCTKLDLKSRQFDGPYPFYDVSTAEKCISDVMLNELKCYEKELLEKYPSHDPMNDAMRCGLKWIFIKNLNKI